VPVAGQPSLAVLPFRNLNDDPEQQPEDHAHVLEGLRKAGWQE
jgi:hypothetical protein